MTRVRVMYWKEIPVQVQAEDPIEKVSRPLDDRFQEGVDAIAMFDGSSGTDGYLEAFEWGQYSETGGSAKEAANATANAFNREFPKDFIKRIRELHRTSERDSRPGAADHWRDPSQE